MKRLGWLVGAAVSVSAVSAARGESMFAAGTQAFSLTAGYAVPVLGDHEYYTSASAGYSWYFAERVAVEPRVRGHYVDPEGAQTVGADFTLNLRWHVWERERWSVFVTGGPGVGYFDHRLPPPDGTRFNFVLQAGAGVTYLLTEGVHLVVMSEFTHFSNAGLQGPDRHPGSNAIGGYVGVMWGW